MTIKGKDLNCERCGSFNTYSTEVEIVCRKCGYRKPKGDKGTPLILNNAKPI